MAEGFKALVLKTSNSLHKGFIRSNRIASSNYMNIKVISVHRVTVGWSLTLKFEALIDDATVTGTAANYFLPITSNQNPLMFGLRLTFTDKSINKHPKYKEIRRYLLKAIMEFADINGYKLFAKDVHIF